MSPPIKRIIYTYTISYQTRDGEHTQEIFSVRPLNMTTLMRRTGDDITAVHNVTCEKTRMSLELLDYVKHATTDLGSD